MRSMFKYEELKEVQLMKNIMDLLDTILIIVPPKVICAKVSGGYLQWWSIRKAIDQYWVHIHVRVENDELCVEPRELNQISSEVAMDVAGINAPESFDRSWNACFMTLKHRINCFCIENSRQQVPIVLQQEILNCLVKYRL